MTLGNIGLKAAARALFTSKKAQDADNASLSQDDKKAPSGLLAIAKSKFKQPYRETTVQPHRRTNLDPTTTLVNTSKSTIPPIEFAPTGLSVISTDIFHTLQDTIVSESVSTGLSDSAESLSSSSTVAEPLIIGPVSIIANSESTTTTSVWTKNDAAKADSSTASSSSTNTALSIQSAAAVPTENLAEPTALDPKVVAAEAIDQDKQSEPSPVVVPEVPRCYSVPETSPPLAGNMSTKKPKADQQKFLGIFHKLKAKIWALCHAKASRTEAKEEEQEEDLSDRCQWDIITKIEPTTIIDVLRSVLTTSTYGGSQYRDTKMKVYSTAQGSYHLVFMVKVINPYKPKLEDWVVKIPGHGTPDRWTAEDEYMLKQEVQTMDLITMFTDVPAPLVFGHSATLDNEFGFPYIVMKMLPGTSATELWYENHTEIPSPETEQKRLTFLRSLARHMTELEKIRFDQIGIPQWNPHADGFVNIDDIEAERMPVGKYHVWPYYDTYASVERGPFPSTQAYVRHARDEDELIPLDPTTKLTEDHVQEYGTSALLDIIFSHPVFHSAPDATFTLRHSDLDTQNLLIDATGAITGILDWDASLAMPRCVGHASVPHFLDRDFHRDSIIRSPFLCWRAPHYRAVYAAALREAGNPDAAYTAKSHMYQAAFAALYEGGDVQDFVERILGEVPGLRVEVHDIKFLLAKGCTATREMLVRELGKVLDPELPPVGFLEGVEEQIRDAVVKGWMDGFEHFFETGVEEM